MGKRTRTLSSTIQSLHFGIYKPQSNSVPGSGLMLTLTGVALIPSKLGSTLDVLMDPRLPLDPSGGGCDQGNKPIPSLGRCARYNPSWTRGILPW